MKIKLQSPMQPLPLLSFLATLCRFKDAFAKSQTTAYNMVEPPGVGVGVAPGCASPHFRPDTPFSVVWNHPTIHTCKGKNSLAPSLEKWGIVHNKGDRWHGEKITLFYRFGHFPIIHGKTGRHINGGVPQLASLYSHIKAIRRNVSALISDPSFSGLGVIDFEDWRPIFYGNWGAFLNYRNLSLHIVKSEHPHLSGSQLKKRAEAEFDEAAKLFLEAGLEVAKATRPHGLWGYYGYPRCWPSNCDTRLSQAHNDRLSYIWRASTALFPSVYHDRGGETWQHLREALRVKAAWAAQATPIFAYSLVYNKTFHVFGKEMLDEKIGRPAETGIDGVVLWGASAFNRKHRCSGIKAYIENTLGPYVRNLTTFFSGCSMVLCHGHGRCVRKDFERRYQHHLRKREVRERHCEMGEDQLTFSYDVENEKTFKGDANEHVTGDFDNYVCKCFKGWSGQTCSLSSNPTELGSNLKAGAERRHSTMVLIFIGLIFLKYH